MKNQKILFTTGQFAAFHQINKRTLHYYDQIGLFSPAYKAENGYRYYTYLQSPTLEMLLTLRELGMPIEEIKSYMKKPNGPAFHRLVTEHIAQIQQTIQHLNQIKRFMMEKDKLLSFSETVMHGQIDIVECPAEYFILSEPIDGSLNEDDFAILMKHIESFRKNRIYHNTYGSMIHTNQLLSGDFENYTCFFTKVSQPKNKKDLHCKPAGRYLRSFCKGNWDNLPQIYENMISYAKQHQLTLQGYSYETGLNEVAIENVEQYVAQILIRCE